MLYHLDIRAAYLTFLFCCGFDMDVEKMIFAKNILFRYLLCLLRLFNPSSHKNSNRDDNGRIYELIFGLLNLIFLIINRILFF